MNKPSAKPFDLVEDIGIAIRTVEDTPQVHIGVLYKPDGVPVRVCHLRTHFDLRDEEPSEPYRWLQVALDPILRRLAVAVCQVIVKRQDKVHFGFTYDGQYFTPDTYAYMHEGLGHGLTCATFILAVFRRIEVELLDVGTWKARDEDTLWQVQMSNLIKQRYSLVGEALARHIGDVRFRPEEVAAGAITNSKPVGFEEAVRVAARVLRDLHRSYR